MEIEETTAQQEISIEEVKTYVRQKLKAFIADKLVTFEKRLTQRYIQSGRPVSSFVSEGTYRVFQEFDRVCDKYINMFELYCEKNILVPRIPDNHVTPLDQCSDEEKELDRKLEKRKHELLECYRKKNILELQRQLILSDFGQALARLGALAEEFPVEKLQEDIKSLQEYREVCQNSKELTELLQGMENVPWTDEQQVNPEMIEGLMRCFDEAGLV
ncbi:hypothetical protein WA171_001173 [Blastocystis sp. BT1]